MGLEDREWYREEQRKKGISGSWDGFKAGKPRVGGPATPAPSASNSRQGPSKQFTPPSYAHLQAEEILEARKEKRARRRLIVCLFALIGALLVYVAFQIP